MTTTRILAIDPGNIQSGWVVIDAHTRAPLKHGIDDNIDILEWCHDQDTFTDITHVAIEMVASYGMAVGETVFDTCVWVGRFTEALNTKLNDDVTTLIKRLPVKLHHCHAANAKDANVTQALVDRFAPGQVNRGKGTKNHPGWFYGFSSHVWQAYALAVFVADTNESRV